MSVTEAEVVAGVRYAEAPQVVIVAAPVGPLVARVVARYSIGLDADEVAAVRRRRAVSGRSMWKRSF